MSKQITKTFQVTNFQSGVRYARQFNGKFDPISKTWAIKLVENDEGQIVNSWYQCVASYGLREVATQTQTLGWQKANGELADHC